MSSVKCKEVQFLLMEPKGKDVVQVGKTCLVDFTSPSLVFVFAAKFMFEFVCVKFFRDFAKKELLPSVGIVAFC